MSEKECPACDGDGYYWDETACGDPEHCSPTYECDQCDGEGVMAE